MGYINKPFSTRQMIFCFAIILVGGAFTMYEVCTQTYAAKKKPYVVTISLEEICKNVKSHD